MADKVPSPIGIGTINGDGMAQSINTVPSVEPAQFFRFTSTDF